MPVNRNLAAIFLGNVWTALVQVAFVPAYIAILGVEAYGLIGVFAFFVLLLSVLDAGFAPVISGEVTRALAGARDMAQVRKLLRSLEMVLLGVGVATVALAAAGAGWLTRHWLDVDSIDASSAATSLRLLAVQVFFRFFVVLHRGVISGAQEIVWLSAVAAGFGTLRGVGVIPVLLAWPSVEAFFAFQACATAVEAGVLAWKSWRLLPHRDVASFSLVALSTISQFSAGTAMIAALWLTFNQSDKLLLSLTLPLREVGHYALASAVAGALSLLVGPFASVGYPRLVELAARGERQGMVGTFHHLAQLVAVTVAPFGFVLAFFAEPLLLLWTGDPALSAATAPMLTALAIASLLNACLAMPHVLVLVHGRQRAVVIVYTMLLALFVPAIYFGSSAFGAMAAGLAWVAMTAMGVALAVPLVGAHLLPAEAWRWLGRDVALPLAAAALGAGIVHAATPEGLSGIATAAFAAFAYLASLAAVMAALKVTRAWFVSGWRAHTDEKAPDESVR